MLLKNKTVFVYDVEVFPNLFTCTIKNTESKTIRSYEISDRRNDLPLIVQLFLNKKIYFCGFNIIHYDSPIISFLLLNVKELIKLPVWEITRKIYDLSNEIIGSQDGQFSSWSKYKYANLFDQLDLLTMMFSNKLRVGLKELQVTMEYPNVQEFDGDFRKSLPISRIDDCLVYNKNDVESSCVLLERLQKDIELRLAIENTYHISALNKDGVNLGMEILKQRYLAETGLSWNQIKDLRSPCEEIVLNDIIFDFIEFQTPELQKLLTELKSLTLKLGQNFERKIWLGGSIQVISSGGIHSQVKPEAFEPFSDEFLVDVDVGSMYPSIILEHKVYPRHLGEEFLKVYGKIRADRFEAKRNHNKVVDATLKLSLNGLSGNLQSEYSWVYDPIAAYKIRINGQLMLLMFAEAVSLLGCRIVQLNTDGAFILAKKKDSEQINQLIKWWQDKTKLILEPEYFERFYQFAINDYVGVKKGWSETHDPELIKRKGAFLENITLGKGMAPRIIAYAVNKELVEGVPCEETIKKCQDIKMFLTYQKVNKDYEVEYNGKIIQHINRYYMSNNGYRLYKCKLRPAETEALVSQILYKGQVIDVPSKELGEHGKYWYNPDVKILKKDYAIKRIKQSVRYNYIQMANSGVTILNKFEDEEIPIEQRRINYHYYINEAQKILLPLKTKQLSLF